MNFLCFVIFIFISFYFTNALSVVKNEADKKSSLIKTLQSDAGWNSGSWERRRYGGRYGGRYRNPYGYNNGYNNYGYNNYGYNQGYNRYNYYYTTPRKLFL